MRDLKEKKTDTFKLNQLLDKVPKASPDEPSSNIQVITLGKLLNSLYKSVLLNSMK